MNSTPSIQSKVLQETQKDNTENISGKNNDSVGQKKFYKTQEIIKISSLHTEYEGVNENPKKPAAESVKFKKTDLVPASDNEIHLQGKLNVGGPEIIGEMGKDNAHERYEAHIKAMIGNFTSDTDFEPDGRLKANLEHKQSQLNKLQADLKNIETSHTETSQSEANVIRGNIENIEKSMNAMKTLSGQIANICLSESYQRGGTEPDKLAARLMMLSSLMEETVLNSKSGKDRTGQLDIELKLLAFQIYSGDGALQGPE